jgi:histidyl-tRNA synthetase
VKADVAVVGVKGMNDILPGEIARWHAVEAAFRASMELGGFREVRTPHLEQTTLFVRSIGETTDVVEKEMFSFPHGRDHLTLRPEGTAGAVRAYVEHRVANNEPVSRWYYLGPMFRAETPQRGRYRQFHQAGAEIFGDPGPACDAELVDGLVRFLQRIGVARVTVHINSIGSGDTRTAYARALRDFLEGRASALSEESRRRLGTNPLRILDSKDPRDQALLADAPPVSAFMSEADRVHFDGVQAHLSALGTAFVVDPRLVRGLDYYTRTLFELKAEKDELGAGNTIVGGGRYDRMVEDLGGPAVPAIGFAAGVERLLIASDLPLQTARIDAFVAPIGPAPVGAALCLARDLRGVGVSAEVDARGAGMKSLLRRANNLGARFALILGEQELADGTVQLKDLDGRAQESVRLADAAATVRDRLARSAS